MSSLASLQFALGYVFRDESSLLLALTHKSFAATQQNERLEFLGDAVLGLVLAEILMVEFPEDPEGQLSKKRASLVNETHLAEIAIGLELGSYMVLGKSELVSSGHAKPRLLASAFEAVLGAIYLEGGIAATKECIEKLFRPSLDTFEGQTLPVVDYKTTLQEIVQGVHKKAPTYDVLDETGPSHARQFTVSVNLGLEVLAEASGPSKKSAEQAAAKLALEKLKQGVQK